MGDVEEREELSRGFGPLSIPPMSNSSERGLSEITDINRITVQWTSIFMNSGWLSMKNEDLCREAKPLDWTSMSNVHEKGNKEARSRILSHWPVYYDS